MKRSFNKYHKKNEIDVDITSLLDILTILLVFLLKSYNPSDLKVDNEKKIQPSKSNSKDIPSFAQVLKIDSTGIIHIDEVKIGSITSNDDLKKIKNFFMKSQIENNKKKLNLLIDKTTDFSKVKKVIQISESVGFSEFKMLVQRK